MTDPKPLPDLRARLLRIILTVLLGGVLILGIALVTIPMFSNTEWVKHSFLTMLETSAGGPIHIDHLEVHLLPTPRIILSALTFRSEAPDPRASLQAKHVEVVFGWDSLWRRQLVLTRGTIQEPELTVQIPFIRDSKEPVEWRFPDIGQLDIQDGHLQLLRESAGETPTKLSWEQIQLTVSGMEVGGATTIELFAQTPEQERPSTLALQGTLALIEQSGSDSGETMNWGIPPFSLQGQIKISHLDLGQLMSFLSNDLPGFSPTRMNFQSEYALKFDADTLAISDFQMSLNGWEVTGQGNITGLQSDSPMLKVSGSTSPTAIGRLNNLLPDGWLPDEGRTFLADRQVDGTVELLTGSVQGPLNQADSLVTEGVIRVEGGRLLTAPGHPPITQLSGTVAFDPHLIRIQNAHGTVTPFTLTAQEITLAFQDAVLVASIPAFQIFRT